MATTAILAAGPGEFLPILFVLIAIASGIINFVKERRAAADRDMVNAGGGNADRELLTEIDAFLEEVSPSDFEETRPPRQRNPQQQRRRRNNSDEEAERRRQVRARREHEKRQAETDRNRKSVGNRQLETSNLSEVSSRHEVANRHVDSSVEDRHLDANLDGPTVERPAPNATAGSSVTELLRSPGGIRDAILLSEILGPPLANRPRRKR